MHAQHITDQQLKETRTNTPHDTIIFELMSLEKPNVGKPVQLSEGFLIKQYQSTIWVPKLAYPTKNFLGSQFLTNLSVETPIILLAATQHNSAPKTPTVASLRMASAPLCLTQALRHPKWVYVSPRRPCVSSLSLCVSDAGPSGALRNTSLHLREHWLLLRLSLWLLCCYLDTISASLFLCTQCPSVALPITDSISLCKPRSRE